MMLVVVAVLAASGLVGVRPAAAVGTSLAGCPHARICAVDGDTMVYREFGVAFDWPAGADDRADRIVNNGSTYDVIVYEHASSSGPPADGWALCVPRGRIVGMAGLDPPVADQASGHRWVAGGTCGGVVSWLREPGAAAAGTRSGTGGTGFVARSVSLARGQLGVREVPTNRGTRVTEYQRSVRDDRIALGEPWCASFVTWLELQAGDPTPFRSAIVGDWVRAASAGRAGLSLVAAASVRAGDLVAFKRAGGWQHMGIVSSVGDRVMVISGNTTAPDGKADGVFEKPVSNWTRLGFTVAYLRNSG